MSKDASPMKYNILQVTLNKPSCYDMQTKSKENNTALGKPSGVHEVLF